MDYRTEKILAAVESLATGSMPIQERLISAMMAMSGLQARDFPKDMREDYIALWAAVTSLNPRGGRSIRLTISEMTDEVAEQFAQRIVALLGELADRHDAP